MKVLMLFLAMVISFGAVTTTNATPNAPQHEEKMVTVILLMDDEDDKKVVATIFTSLMTAEKIANVLDIEMTASDDPVNDDIFVFALKSENQKEVALKMFDEEGFGVAANRVLEVNEGNTYRALNVQSLEDGTYIFQLSDGNGAEMTRKVTIKRD